MRLGGYEPRRPAGVEGVDLECWSLIFRIWSLGFTAWDSEFIVHSSEFRAHGSGVKV